MRRFRIAFLSTALLGAVLGAGAQGIVLSYAGTDSYVLTEKSDWSRYEDGRYVGHVYREVRARMEPDSAQAVALWSGDFLVFEETLRDMSAAARLVEGQVPASFRISGDGTLRMETDRGYPSFRGFPAFSARPVLPGGRWTAEGVRAVDPRNRGTSTRTRILVEYEYKGEEVYKGIPVRRIFAKYAVRYRAGQDPAGDPALLEATGTHDADILVRADSGRPVIIRDRLDETFRFSDGPALRHKGFTLTFFDAAIPRGADPAEGVLLAALEPSGKEAANPPSPGSESVPSSRSGREPSGLMSAGSAETRGPGESELDLSSPSSELALEHRPEGPTLVAFGLRFEPDRDALLEEERGRMDGIAEALKRIPGERTFLVSGHTADVGNPAGQKELSIRRARRIVEELVARGIPASRFIYRGFGAERPVAPNDTGANRERNRRVEITVLQ